MTQLYCMLRLHAWKKWNCSTRGSWLKLLNEKRRPIFLEFKGNQSVDYYIYINIVLRKVGRQHSWKNQLESVSRRLYICNKVVVDVQWNKWHASKETEKLTWRWCLLLTKCSIKSTPKIFGRSRENYTSGRNGNESFQGILFTSLFIRLSSSKSIISVKFDSLKRRFRRF